MQVKERIERLIRRDEVLRDYSCRLFNKKDGGKFLDLSCGARSDIQEIVKSFGYTWVGVDHMDRSGVVKADAHALPFPDSQFDVVYAGAAFEHYRDPWHVAEEVRRVLRPNAYFCGLVAFVQPWHGESYYHFSHLGVREMLQRMDLEVLDIHAGDVNGVTYLIRVLFHYWNVGRVLSVYGSLLYGIRRWFFPLLVRFAMAGNKERRAKELASLRDDPLRFAASIIFLGRKKAPSEIACAGDGAGSAWAGG